jgi:hypothetical protein
MRAVGASWKSPVDTPRRYTIGNKASRPFIRRAHFGKIAIALRCEKTATNFLSFVYLGGLHLDQIRPHGLEATLEGCPI